MIWQIILLIWGCLCGVVTIVCIFVGEYTLAIIGLIITALLFKTSTDE